MDATSIVVVLFLALLLIVTATRILSERPESVTDPGKKSIWIVPYWLPLLGHAVSFIYDPIKLMSEARDQSAHGIFALKLGMGTHNIISDPGLVRGVMAQRESTLEFHPIAWAVVERFFGVSTTCRTKFNASGAWQELSSGLASIMREPRLSNLLKPTVRNLEDAIPRMLSFTSSEIDQQPWERFGKACYISDSEVEINLVALMRDMLGNASVPSVFGRGFMEKYPEILHDIYTMDAGFMYFLMGLPAWTPWPSVYRAHRARTRIRQALDEQQRALDSLAKGEYIDATWGNLDDVSELIMSRNALYREFDFEIKDRVDLPTLWALVVNANLLVYWQLLHILATPGLTNSLRKEVAPHVQVSKPVSIGKFSEAPKLTISHDGLSKHCPLLKATYFEAMRLSSQPWSIRQVAAEVTISTDKQAIDPVSYIFRKGEYVTVPHDLHMRDPKYFKDPDKFDPERFLTRDENGTLSAEIGTIRPYGGGPSQCKGRIYAERECLALVAGVLVFWDFEPADGAWVIPKQKKTTAVSLPVHETRVRIKRRRFQWDN